MDSGEIKPPAKSQLLLPGWGNDIACSVNQIIKDLQIARSPMFDQLELLFLAARKHEQGGIPGTVPASNPDSEIGDDAIKSAEGAM
jgi:hypothetical protein